MLPMPGPLLQAADTIAARKGLAAYILMQRIRPPIHTCARPPARTSWADCDVPVVTCNAPFLVVMEGAGIFHSYVQVAGVSQPIPAIVNGPHSHHTLDTDVVWRPALPPSAATCAGSDPELVLPVQWTTSMMSTDASVALRYLRYCEHDVKVKPVCQEITSAWSCISGCLLTCLADD